MEHWWTDNTHACTKVLGDNPVLVPLCVPRITYGLHLIEPGLPWREAGDEPPEPLPRVVWDLTSSLPYSETAVS